MLQTPDVMAGPIAGRTIAVIGSGYVGLGRRDSRHPLRGLPGLGRGGSRAAASSGAGGTRLGGGDERPVPLPEYLVAALA
jgi:hypothetical protein